MQLDTIKKGFFDSITFDSNRSVIWRYLQGWIHGKFYMREVVAVSEWACQSGWDISREPGSQNPTKSSDSHEIFAAIHAVLAQIWLQGISCQMKEFFLSHTICRKYSLVRGRNILALQVINCHRKIFLVTERNLHSRSRAEISCHKKKFLVTGGNFLSEAVISCHRKKFLAIRQNFLSIKETFCHRKEFQFN